MTPRKIQPDSPDDDAPEADAAWFARARPAAEVLPSLVGEADAASLLAPRRGRPKSAAPKAHVNIRIDVDVLDAFKRTGAGWQTRINHALRAWLEKEKESA